MRSVLRLMFFSGLAGSFALAQDPVKVAPQQVTVAFENDYVRVLRFDEPPHIKLPMHSHPAYVVAGFTGDHWRYTFPDGKTKEMREKAGVASFNEGETHASESLSATPTRSVMVELKKKPAKATTAKMAPDAVKVDPKHYKVELNNNLVRVLRIQYGPHEKSPMHRHPGAVAVFLTDYQVKFTFPDGKTQEVQGKAEDAMWNEASQHAPENLSDKRLELILVELKS